LSTLKVDFFDLHKDQGAFIPFKSLSILIIEDDYVKVARSESPKIRVFRYDHHFGRTAKTHLIDLIYQDFPLEHITNGLSIIVYGQFGGHN